MNLLEELTERILKEKSTDFSNWIVVFPNKRAGLFFKKLIGQKINQPIWAPSIISISDLFETLSPYQIADKISSVFRLYKILEKHYSRKESFEQFYYWGESLLSDFEEIDKYLIDPTYIFKDLRDVKELESGLPFLTEEQKQWILKYWESFSDVLSKDQKETLGIWKILLKVYNEFTSELINEKTVYQGLAYRWVAENIESGLNWPAQKIIFAGFNALSSSEEKLISWCLQHMDCEIFWDADDYYLKDPIQEAGFFLRSYALPGTPLSETFKPEYQSEAFRNKVVEVIECSTDNGQAQEAGKILKEIIGKGGKPESTGVILPSEKLLLPVLDAIPEEIPTLNITMGYPLQNSLTYSFLASILELQLDTKNGKSTFYYKATLKVLYHPFIYSGLKTNCKKIIDKIREENILFPDQSLFSIEDTLLPHIFKKVEGTQELLEYLQECLLMIVERDDHEDFESEFAFHFYRLLNNLKTICYTYGLEISQQSIYRLIKQAIYRERLPFEGEPLEGLQIMGFMETRNLHFDHVVLLSAEEGSLPPGRQEVSFLPYALRKAYGLPTTDHYDAIFSYLFYRLIHNCKSITIIYNSNAEKGNTGEISRFVKQLDLESDIAINYSTQNLDIAPPKKYSITIKKNEEVLDRLKRYTLQDGQFKKRFSPSAFNIYLDCSLRFYFRYVLDLYEEDEIEESIQERELGLLFHNAIELAYCEYDVDGKRLVTKEKIDDLIRNIDIPIRQAFANYYHKEADTIKISGQSELVYEVIRELMTKVLSIDRENAPFELVGVEADQTNGYFLDLPVTTELSSHTVGIKGVLDRIDKKNEVIRIIDYKTGRDSGEFSTISSLFDPENSARNKAVFQTFLYALFYQNAHPNSNEIIQAGLFNLKEMYQEDFNLLIRQKENRQSTLINDVRSFLDEYKSELTRLLENIFHPDIDFVQTEKDQKCRYCPYNYMCNREV